MLVPRRGIVVLLTLLLLATAAAAGSLVVGTPGRAARPRVARAVRSTPGEPRTAIAFELRFPSLMDG